jgi:hypothetical protein
VSPSTDKGITMSTDSIPHSAAPPRWRQFATVTFFIAAITLGSAPASAEPGSSVQGTQMDHCVTNGVSAGADKNAVIASCCKSLGGTVSANSQGTTSCQFPDGNTWTAPLDQQQGESGPTPPPPGATAILPPGSNTRAGTQ